MTISTDMLSEVREAFARLDECERALQEGDLEPSNCRTRRVLNVSLESVDPEYNEFNNHEIEAFKESLDEALTELITSRRNRALLELDKLGVKVPTE